MHGLERDRPPREEFRAQAINDVVVLSVQHLAGPSRMKDPLARAPRGPAFATNTIGQAIAELYNEAQLDALRRMGQMIEEEVKGQATASAGSS